MIRVLCPAGKQILIVGISSRAYTRFSGAVRGSERERAVDGKKKIDMLTGSLWDKILLYTLPLAATGILQQLFNAADVVVVGRFTGDRGAAAMAAVGANSPLIGLILNVFVGVSLGTNVVIANAVGTKDRSTIGKAVHTSILFSVICGTLMAILGEVLAVPILRLLSVPDAVLPMAVLYLRIYLVGLPVILLYNFESAIYRGVGNTRTPLGALTAAGIVNVFLNLFFVVIVGMTVDGVAAATVISNVISSMVLLYDLTRFQTDIRVEWKRLRIDGPVFRRILRIGIPTGIQTAVFSMANIIIQSAINSLGTIVMAASSAAFNIEMFVYDVLNSFSQACTTFVAQNNGAGNMPRCKRVLGLCLAENAACTAVSVFVVLLFGKKILSLFTADQQVIDTGYVRLVLIFTAYIFTILYEVISGYLRGFGISARPAVLTTLGICGVRIGWIYLVFPRDPTFHTIMMAYPYSLATTALLMSLTLIVLRPAGKRLSDAAER